INFRIAKLLASTGKAKNSEKELLSIVKVLQELIKGINGQSKENHNEYLAQKKAEVNCILQTTKQKIMTQIAVEQNEETPNKNPLLELLYTLKIILEMKQKNLDFQIGLDFNQSEIKNFQISEGKILIPFSAITGIGEVIAKKITDYRQQKGQINN
ncbi:13184_t:CDS:2, partial [Funneliformis geosporum]